MTSYIFEIYKNHVEYREKEFSNYKSELSWLDVARWNCQSLKTWGVQQCVAAVLTT